MRNLLTTTRESPHSSNKDPAQPGKKYSTWENWASAIHKSPDLTCINTKLEHNLSFLLQDWLLSTMLCCLGTLDFGCWSEWQHSTCSHCPVECAMLLSHFSCVWLFVTLCMTACQIPHPWDSPGKNIGMGCHFLLQGIFPTQGWNLSLPHCRQIPYCWATREVDLGECWLLRDASIFDLGGDKRKGQLIQFWASHFVLLWRQ